MSAADWIRPLRRLRGLRGRLVVAFVVVTALGASAAAFAGVQQTSRTLVDSSQQQHVGALVEQITAVAPGVQYPPSQESLDQLRIAAGRDSLVVFEDMESADGFFAAGQHVLPTQLQEAVWTQGSGDSDPGHVLTQRIMADGRPRLLIGTPVAITEPNGQRSASGIEVYTARDLSVVESQVSSLAWRTAGTSALVLPLAIAVALLASGSVLRPVARLRTTARRLTDGELDVRAEARGIDELAQLTHTVNEMAESLEESMSAMARMQQDAKRFAADVSHELRTPLTTLTAAVEVLHGALSEQRATGPAPDGDVTESAQLAIIETRRLVQLVDDIMEIARFDAGTAVMRWEETDVLAAVLNCLRSRGWSGDVEVGTIPVSRGRQPDQSFVVQADRRRLDIVLANLIGNAIKHGGAPVRVELTASTEGVCVQVTDRGPGIEEHSLPRIFSRFYKADAARTRTPGSGLGLAIAQENAHLHHGEITAENLPGEGAEFSLWLPSNSRDRTNGSTEQ